MLRSLAVATFSRINTDVDVTSDWATRGLSPWRAAFNDFVYVIACVAIANARTICDCFRGSKLRSDFSSVYLCTPSAV